MAERARREAAPFPARGGRVAGAVLLAGLGLVLALSAWICDDAFVTLRAVEQTVAGHGPRWNPDERVQAFTHPAWFLIALALRLLVAPVVWPLLAASVALVVAGAARLGGGTADRRALGFAVAAIVASRTMVDFSTSGLETPLLVVLVFEWTRRVTTLDAEVASVDELAGLSGIAAALLLARLDGGFLLAPSIARVTAEVRRRALPLDRRALARSVSLRAAPLALWSGFAFVYYGSVWPNPALAKLGHGLGRTDLALQGLRYLWVSCGWDPVLGALLALAAVAAATAGGRWRALAAGLLLQTAWTVAIGGDFMAGRFLVVPAAAAIAILARRLGERRLAPAVARAAWASLALLGALGWSSARRAPGAPGGWRFWEAERFGIQDERAWYAEAQDVVGLALEPPRARSLPLGRPRVEGAIGRIGYESALEQIVVDRMALADPLLARLPALPGSRIGHFERALPEGYLASRSTGKNLLKSPVLSAFESDLETIHRGPILDLRRWLAAIRLGLDPPRFACPEPPCREFALALGAADDATTAGELEPERRATVGAAVVVEATPANPDAVGRLEVEIRVDRSPVSWRVESLAPRDGSRDWRTLRTPFRVRLVFRSHAIAARAAPRVRLRLLPRARGAAPRALPWRRERPPNP